MAGLGVRDHETAETSRSPLVGVLVVAVCLAVGQAVGWLCMKWLDMDSTSREGLIIVCFVASVPTLILIGVWIRAVERRPFSSVGFGGVRRFRGIGLGIAAAVVFLLVLNLGAGAFGGEPADGGGASATLGTSVLLLAATAVQSSTEEVLFRGFLLRRFTRRWGVAAGVLGSSVLFACAHLANPDAPVGYVVMTFLLGVALALWALADGALWRTCAFHTVWNFLPNLLAGGSDKNASADFDGSTIAVAGVVLCLVIATALRSYRRSLKASAPGVPQREAV